MAATANLGLTKPAYTDYADIAVLNGNFDKIDAAIGLRPAAEGGVYPEDALPDIWLKKTQRNAANGVAPLDANARLPYANAPNLGRVQTKNITTADWPGTVTSASRVAVATVSGACEIWGRLVCPVTTGAGVSVTAYRVFHGFLGFSTGVLLMSWPGIQLAGDTAPAAVSTGMNGASMPIHGYLYSTNQYTTDGSFGFSISGSENSMTLYLSAASYTNPSSTYGPVTGVIYRRLCI